ncbi:hypothetical protein IKH83_01850 [Candidatus Saccharibacteria bacterium]|nr:hypothetical protein [Candidatus Saccharibacteria bacterium]
MYGELKIKDIPKQGFGEPLPHFEKPEASFYVVRGEKYLSKRIRHACNENGLNCVFFWRPANLRYPRKDEAARMYGVFVFLKRGETKIKYQYEESDVPVDRAIEFMGQHVKLWLFYVNNAHHPGLQSVISYADRISDQIRDATHYIPVREGIIDDGICRFEFKDTGIIISTLNTTSVRRI